MALWEAHELQSYQSICNGTYSDENVGAVKDLVNGGFVFLGEVDELSILYRQYHNHRFDRSTMILTIAPTMGCNFQCDYCFQGDGKSIGFMSREVQDGIVGLVKRVSGELKRLHIAWYGGEPLLNTRVLESLSDQLISFCDIRCIQYDSMMVTNGYLLNADAARSLHVRRVKSIQITLDGQQEDHDSRRPLLSGRPTFNKILDNIKSIVDEVPINFCIRVNIDSRNGEGIHQLIDNMVAMGLGNKRNLKLYFAPVEATTEACHAIADVCMSKGQYSSLETDLYRHGFESGLTVLPYPPRFRGSCGAVRPRSLVVLPNGDIHKCWHTTGNAERRVGTIFDLDSINHDPTMTEWLSWNPFQDSRCMACKILPNCAGGCGYKALYPEAGRGEAGTLPCISWKYNIFEMLVLRAVAMGMISRDDYDPQSISTEENDLRIDDAAI